MSAIPSPIQAKLLDLVEAVAGVEQEARVSSSDAMIMNDCIGTPTTSSTIMQRKRDIRNQQADLHTRNQVNTLERRDNIQAMTMKEPISTKQAIIDAMITRIIKSVKRRATYKKGLKTIRRMDKIFG
jgi:hypothetical protein